ncbi:MAG: glycosyltransferase family 4 protein [Conexibacter sp.]|nr:glycosyltransferase family 4 protein [Conexibacter sp.]
MLSLDEALGVEWDVALATWWQTTSVLFDLRARRHAYFIQLLEDSVYPTGAPEQLAAAMTTSLPVRFITEARWLAELLEDYQPGNRVLYVRNGIPKDIFQSPATVVPGDGDGPLRIVLEGARGDGHKGVDDALAVVAAMDEAAHVTWISPRPDSAAEGVDRVLTGLSADEMAEVFGESHVLLKLSRAEGMYGPPLEAFHMGSTVVTTAVTGHDEYVEHGVNGLVVGWDDLRGTARVLDLLARDRRLLHELRTGALRTAQAWPDWRQASQWMALALRRVAAEPGPPVAPAGARLVSDFSSATGDAELLRWQLQQAHEAHERYRGERTLGGMVRRRARTELARTRARLGAVKRRLLGLPKRLLRR